MAFSWYVISSSEEISVSKKTKTEYICLFQRKKKKCFEDIMKVEIEN